MEFRSISSGMSAFALALLIAAVFLIDTVTDLEIAVAVLYVVVVLLAARLLHVRGVLLTSVACIAATLLSYRLQSKDGASQTSLVNCVLSLVATAATTYLSVAIKRVANAERQARTELANVVRMASLAQLSASIAHEINQPLAAIAASGNAALRWLAATPPNIGRAQEAVDSVVSDATRGGEIVRRIRSLAGGAAAPTEPLDLNEVVLEVVGLMQGDLRARRISLRPLLSGTLPPIAGHRVQLQQIMINLIANAGDAIDANPASDREIVVATAQRAPGTVQLTIRDDGVGFDAAKAAQVFDAFYTTKEGGMGLGLAISRTLVEAHGGKIWAEPRHPGAVLNVTLPAIASADNNASGVLE